LQRRGNDQARCPFQRRGNRSHIDESAEPRRIHLRNVRREDQIDLLGFQERQIARKVARVARQVF
jgi:hypothetical protein